MDASASILRPLSPYGHDRRGLPSFPRMSALRCCSSSVRRGIMCCGIGGQGAWQPSLRSGRLRRPARAEQDNSRRRTSCPQCLMPVRRAGASLLAANAQIPPMAASRCFGGQVNCPRRRRTPPRPLSSRGEAPPSIRGGLSASIPAAFQSSVSCWYGRSGLRTISAPVGTFLLPALSHSTRQTAASIPRYRHRVSVAFGGQLRRPRQHRHRGTKKAGRIVLRSWTLITACS